MSITKWSQEPGPSHVRCAKAFSWHYPNREYLSSLLDEKEQRQQYHAIRAILENRKEIAQLDGCGGNGMYESRRIRLSRLNSLKLGKLRIKKNSGLIHTVLGKHEQELDRKFNRDPFYQKSKTDNIKKDYQPVTMDTRATEKTLEQAWKEAGAPRIPENLSEKEKDIYKKLIRVRRDRKVSGATPPQVVVITDLGKDYDDLAAMVALKELHRIGLIKLEGFIANLHPPKDRARFGRGCLDTLGLRDIPIAWGEEAQTDATKWTPPKYYEFPEGQDYFKAIWGETPDFTPYGQEKNIESEIESGVKFLDRIVNDRLQNPKKGGLTFLLISSLSDIATFAKREPENLVAVTKNVILQGSYSLEQGPNSHHQILTANLKAANNAFDKQSATEFHEYMDKNHIPSVVYTKPAASAAALPPTVFEELRDTNQPVGIHLQHIQAIQDLEYYENACDPKKRFLPHLDQDWFLKTRTIYPKIHGPNWKTRTDKPKGKEVLQYVQLVCYDALAALGTAGNDVLRELNVLQPPGLFAQQDPQIHKIVGVEGVEAAEGVQARKEDPGINVENMKLALTALLKGSLMALQQGIPSTHIAP